MTLPGGCWWKRLKNALIYLIQGVTVPGFAFLASIIAIFWGAQLFALSIIGEVAFSHDGASCVHDA